MSSIANKFFGPSSGGQPNLRDFQHAARLFTDGDLRLAPKAKYLYHVFFTINRNAISTVNSGYLGKHQNEINMLVKGVDLPKFNVQTEILNQYNRRKNLQIKIDYGPVMIRFHDDNAGISRQLWESYYNYYYADSSSTRNPNAYRRSAMKGAGSFGPAYGLDNSYREHFFDDITIYQIDKKKWNSYKLVNPMIQNWSHDVLDSGNSQPAEQSMTIIYESVAYNSGDSAQGNPKSFGIEHYDTTPSPYGVSSAGRISGALQGAASVLGALSSGEAFKSPINALATAATAINTYNNIKSLSKTKIGTVDAIAGVLSGVGSLATAVNNISGVQNVRFPASDVVNTIKAGQVALTNVGNAIRRIGTGTGGGG
jgi:hypothetical protein